MTIFSREPTSLAFIEKALALASAFSNQIPNPTGEAYNNRGRLYYTADRSDANENILSNMKKFNQIRRSGGLSVIVKLIIQKKI